MKLIKINDRGCFKNIEMIPEVKELGECLLSLSLDFFIGLIFMGVFFIINEGYDLWLKRQKKISLQGF